MKYVLLVDDDLQALNSLQRAIALGGTSFEIIKTQTPAEALQLAVKYRPQVAVIDLCLNEREGIESGLSLLSQLLIQDSSARHIVLTGHGSTDVGVRCLRLGAASFLEKPAQIPHLVALIEDGIRQADIRRDADTNKGSTHSQLSQLMVAESAAMKTVADFTLRAAKTGQSVFINGETGTGKGLLAKTIHTLSNRSNAPFVRYQPVNDSLDLITRDLFGAVKGAYTGAHKDSCGLIGRAHNGTLFLDEIDALPPAAQVALLGVLQEKRYRPTGSEKELVSNFRVIAATNLPIEQALSSNKLRHDLYQRISGLQIVLPPLRERREDIPELCYRTLQRLQESEGVSVFELSLEAETALKDYHFPGNIRELESIVEEAAHRAFFEGREQILLPDLTDRLSADFETIASGPIVKQQKPSPLQSDLGADLPDLTAGMNSLLDDYRFRLATAAMQQSDGNISQAARLLKIDRKALRKIISSEY